MQGFPEVLTKSVFLCLIRAFGHNHRMVWVGRDLKIISLQPPCHGQGHLSPDLVAQSPIQPGLEHCQGGGSHSFSGQPVPVPHHPHSKVFLPYI